SPEPADLLVIALTAKTALGSAYSAIWNAPPVWCEGPVSYALQHGIAQPRWRGPFVARPCGWRIGSAAPRGLVRLSLRTAISRAPAQPECSSGLGAMVEHLVMRRALVEVREHR